MFEVILRDETCEVVGGADAYQLEGPMTTFFRHGAGRQVVDCWSTRIASFRTSEVMIIRRVEDEAPFRPLRNDQSKPRSRRLCETGASFGRQA